MKYDVEMGSGAMIYIYIYIYIKFHEDLFRHSKVYMGGIHRHTDRMVIS
jgi:hypothetical protein